MLDVVSSSPTKQLISYLNTIISKGIWVAATMNVMKNNRIRNGYMVRQGDMQGPALATGTTVTSA